MIDRWGPRGGKPNGVLYEGAQSDSDCAELVPILQRIQSRGWAQAGLYRSIPSL